MPIRRITKEIISKLNVRCTYKTSLYDGDTLHYRVIATNEYDPSVKAMCVYKGENSTSSLQIGDVYTFTVISSEPEFICNFDIYQQLTHALQED